MRRLAMWIGVSALLWTSSAQAGPGTDLLRCVHMDQTTCPALQLALASPTAAAAEVGKALTDPKTSAKQVANAGVALGLLLGKKSGPVLYKAAQAHSKGSLTRVELMAAAARNGAKEAASELVAALDDSNPRAQILAVGGLLMLKHKAAGPKVQQLLKHKSGHVQAAAARALKQIGGDAAVTPLLDLAGTANAFIPARTLALEALQKIAPKRALSVAARLVDHPSRAIGRAALNVIGAAPVRWTAPVIRFGLETPGLRGRAGLAAAAHKSLGREVLVAALATDLTDDERSWLLHALGQLRPLGAGQALVGRLDKLTEAAKIEVLKTLPTLKDQTVVPPLVKALETTKGKVANYIIYALENVSGQRLGDNLDAWRSYAGLDKAPAAAPAAPTEP